MKKLSKVAGKERGMKKMKTSTVTPYVGHVVRTVLQMNFGFAVISMRNGSMGNLLYEEMLQFISFLVMY
ncbi:uncharacterized protein E5676_scaffold367G00170 [Cucumis melo var. makuwa]|uniref:Uncharacterized protein n=2 Tax=Cucumis melo TaxID=3656 RepID=A0A5D3CGG9_CUCMM|nr:uncharacterized protein E5676_scaffold367G00170 [Cucumis melo var. makuwa]